MDENLQILYMQTRLVRLASEQWNIHFQTVNELFQKYGVFQYVADCWGVFHVEGDFAVLEDVKQYLKNKGANIG